MSDIEIEAKTVEEAIVLGLKKLGVSRENAEIKILNEGTTGLFGLMGNKPAKVLVSSKVAAAAASSGTRSERSEHSSHSDHAEYVSCNADYVLAQKQTKEIVSEILKLMKFECKEVNTAMLTGRILADIKSADSKFIIGKQGQTLDALEHIVNLMLHRDEKTRVKVSLDTESYRVHQEERVMALAQKAAEQVKLTGKPYHFDPMSSKERRLLHVALKADTAVETFSEGEGMFRKVVIKPANNASK